MSALRAFVARWDEEIDTWVRARAAGTPPPEIRAARSMLRDAWLGGEAPAGDDHLTACPEPFVGPVLGEPACVVLAHNPGPAVRDQLPGGALFERLARGERFSTLAAAFELAPETRRWWRRYAEWIAPLVGGGDRARPQHVAGFDLLPWHTLGRARITATGPVAGYLRGELLPAIAEATIRAQLRARIDGAERPVLVATHPWVEAALLELGARVHARIDGGTDPWPRSFSGRPVRRSLTLLELADPPLAVFATSSPGSNLPPGRAFDPVITRFLRDAAR